MKCHIGKLYKWIICHGQVTKETLNHGIQRYNTWKWMYNTLNMCKVQEIV